MSISQSIINSRFSAKKSIVACLALFLLVAIAFSPLASAVAPYPTYALATVDGDYSEWDLALDFFADMYRSGDDKKPVESKLYIRYDVASSTVYVLVLAEPDVPVETDDEEAWVAIDKINNHVVDDQSGNDGVPPDFAWVSVGGKTVGYEASFVLPPGDYEIIVHVNVYDDGESQTSKTLNTLRLFVVPEPGTLIAFASVAGAAGLFAVYRRRRK